MSGNSGNARDNRQRGNAAQLLEKYKNMARDAQLAGDRVQTEYYLQFADHYFRVLGEGRARFEEQRRQNGDEDGDDEGDEMMEADGEGDYEVAERQPRRRPEQREQRADRPERGDRGDRPERPERAERAEPREIRRERRPANGRADHDETAQRMPFDALPPAIGGDDRGGDEEAAAEPVARPRRTRRPRVEDSDGEGAAA